MSGAEENSQDSIMSGAEEYSQDSISRTGILVRKLSVSL